MPDGLMTLTMTREVFPYFKRLLEGVRFIDDDGPVKLAVTEGPPGVVQLTVTRVFSSQETRLTADE